jgi:hypothetical protein
MPDPRILFVVDKFRDEPRDERSPYPGGAEMTDAALMAACPWKLEGVRVRDLKRIYLKDFDVHVVGNLSQASRQQIRDLCVSGRHVLFEHDVRICRFRGNFPEAWEPVHRFRQRCCCPHFYLRPLYRSAMGVIYLTQRQMEVFHRNPFFRCSRELVLGGSAMDKTFFERVDRVKRRGDNRKKGTCIAYSRGPIKGYKQALEYCRKKGVDPLILKDLTPDEILDQFEHAAEFVFFPIALEPSGRMPLEARFLGCEVLVNRHVGVAGESWWKLDDSRALNVVRDIPNRFWKLVERLFGESLRSET